ncbi:MAG TPA: RluA family pseudouridine synthase [Polyangia bacterium]|nr:RluA family pseudouridine synthase [Polyangia bacterium]
MAGGEVEVVEWTVAAEEAGQRLDHFVADRAGCSHAAARRLVVEERVRVDGRRGRKGGMVRAGERVTVEGPLPEAGQLQPVPEAGLGVEVIYVDEDLVALAKPPGMASHPLRAGERGTLANALVARFPECAEVGADPREAGLVHRLDRDTSGVLMAARHAAAWQSLRRVFREGRVGKEYLALVAGEVQAPGEVDLPLAHHPGDRKRMRVARPGEEGQPARTQFAPLAGAGGKTLLVVRMSTGRMHQVRVHLAHAGHPLVGDLLYGGPEPLPGLEGHFLHAWRIELPHPGGAHSEDQSWMTWLSGPPQADRGVSAQERSTLMIACPLFAAQREALLQVGIHLPEEMRLKGASGELVTEEP